MSKLLLLFTTILLTNASCASDYKDTIARIPICSPQIQYIIEGASYFAESVQEEPTEDSDDKKLKSYVFYQSNGTPLRTICLPPHSALTDGLVPSDFLDNKAPQPEIYSCAPKTLSFLGRDHPAIAFYDRNGLTILTLLYYSRNQTIGTREFGETVPWNSDNKTLGKALKLNLDNLDRTACDQALQAEQEQVAQKKAAEKLTKFYTHRLAEELELPTTPREAPQYNRRKKWWKRCTIS